MHIITKPLRKILKKLFNKYGYKIIQHSNLYDWQIEEPLKLNYNESNLPADAKDYLDKNNPILKALQKTYSKFDTRVTQPLIWNKHYIKSEDILFFRGDNIYVRQLNASKMNILGYALSAYYALERDPLNLFSILKEDNYFGNYCIAISNRLISRDLLDSILEIYFLEKYLKIISHSKNLNILDIGAGYGRLAHRTITASQGSLKYFCTDAIAISSFISEYYINFRKVHDRALVIPLYDIIHTLENNPIDIAINVHSFSECRLSAIEWWISLLKKYEIRYLMIVPNGDKQMGSLLLTVQGENFMEIIIKHGYKLVAKEPKFSDPIVQKYGLYPTYHYLFELQY
ncbi:MAG: hypothetical protein GWP19_09415 [Planctomycetia bacterium]|nr:hypothetical protein [Planctomycetia bacterium]